LPVSGNLSRLRQTAKPIRPNRDWAKPDQEEQ